MFYRGNPYYDSEYVHDGEKVQGEQAKGRGRDMPNRAKIGSKTEGLKQNGAKVKRVAAKEYGTKG